MKCFFCGGYADTVIDGESTCHGCYVFKIVFIVIFLVIIVALVAVCSGTGV